MEEAMVERGKGCDPPINFSYGGVVSQTTDSHRLIEKAYELKGEEGQLRLVERYVSPFQYSNKSPVVSALWLAV